MKSNNRKSIRWQSVLFATAVTVAALLEPAYCQTESSVLLLQKTPPQGGTTTPDAGIHQFNVNSDVAISAWPKPGYQFICWLGDVIDPTVNSTTVYLDAPKIVIAVFERAQYDLLNLQESPRSASGGGFGGDNLAASGASYSRQGFAGSGGGKRQKFSWPNPPAAPLIGPQEGVDPPSPTPEPATALMLVLGTMFAFRMCGWTR
ncbi:MAG: InlB B-repeat-containing protein [Planctomycetota bacterium]